MHIIENSLENMDGVFLNLKLKSDELISIRELIREEYLTIIRNKHQKLIKNFELIPMHEYHNQSHLIDHAKLWPKQVRCLSRENLNIFKSFNFFEDLQNVFGNIDITDEDEIGRDEVYWRLVRPNCKNDVGPLHADNWFWELNNKNQKNKKRYKIWMPIFCETGDTGFMYVLNSHKKTWKYDKIFKDGKYKPIPNIDQSKLSITKFSANPGNMILFNDKLLHGGYSTSNTTRVSLEFTLLVN